MVVQACVRPLECLHVRISWCFALHGVFVRLLDPVAALRRAYHGSRRDVVHAEVEVLQDDGGPELQEDVHQTVAADLRSAQAVGGNAPAMEWHSAAWEAC